MVQAQVLALLRSLRDRTGCSFLLITHDLGVAAQVADRVAVIYAGRLAELGPTGTVLRSAAHPYSTALIRCRPRGGHAHRRRARQAGQPVQRRARLRVHRRRAAGLPELTTGR